MLKKTKTTRDFLIFSTSLAERINYRIQHLTFQARQAYYERNYREVVVAGQKLVETKSGEPYGKYFLALAMTQQGKKKSKTAKEIFQELANCDNKPVRAASFLALGKQAYRIKDYSEARYLIKQASEIAKGCNNAIITSTMCQTGLAAICSDLGDYRTSVSLMQESLPIIFFIGQYLPAYMTAELNNYAYDLNQTNRPEIASQIITKVAQSPYAKLYPEWLETKTEIDAKLNNVTEIAEYQKAKKKFTEISSSLDIYTKRHEPRHLFGQIALLESDTSSCDKIDYYFSRLEKMQPGQEDNNISVESYLCNNGRKGLINTQDIDEDNLEDLETLINETNAITVSAKVTG